MQVPDNTPSTGIPASPRMRGFTKPRARYRQLTGGRLRLSAWRILARERLHARINLRVRVCAKVLPILRMEAVRVMRPRTEARIHELGITLPKLPAPGGNYLSAKTVGNLVFLAGVISTGPEGVITGTVGLDSTVEEAYRAAALTQLVVLQGHLGSLDE